MRRRLFRLLKAAADIHANGVRSTCDAEAVYSLGTALCECNGSAGETECDSLTEAFTRIEQDEAQIDADASGCLWHACELCAVDLRCRSRVSDRHTALCVCGV